MSPGYIPLHAFLIYLFKSSMFRISYIFVTEPFLRETPRNIFCTKRNGCERMKSIDVGMTNMDWVITWTELSKQPFGQDLMHLTCLLNWIRAKFLFRLQKIWIISGTLFFMRSLLNQKTTHSFIGSIYLPTQVETLSFRLFFLLRSIPTSISITPFKL